MNTHLLVTDALNFSIEFEINPYMHQADQPDRDEAVREHQAIMAAHKAADRTLEYLPSAPGCPDMVYVANSGLTRGKKVILSSLPPERQPETPHYRQWYSDNDYEVIEPPYLFSGQGDALPCGDMVIAGSGWRTDPRMHNFIQEQLGYKVVSVKSVGPEWYDIDLAVAIIRPDLIAFCPEALEAGSVKKLTSLSGVNHITVSLEEAQKFALNLVSDGQTVTMTNVAPQLAVSLRNAGLAVVELKTTELGKGGGGIRCTSLSLDN